VVCVFVLFVRRAKPLSWRTEFDSRRFQRIDLFFNPRVRKIRNEASSCPRIFSRILRFGRGASGGALAPEPPLAIGVGPEFHGFCPFPVDGIWAGPFPPFFSSVFEIGHLLVLRSDFNWSSDFNIRSQIGGGFGRKIGGDGFPAWQRSRGAGNEVRSQKTGCMISKNSKNLDVRSQKERAFILKTKGGGFKTLQECG